MMALAIEVEMAAEATAMEMGWVPLEGEDGTKNLGMLEGHRCRSRAVLRHST